MFCGESVVRKLRKKNIEREQKKKKGKRKEKRTDD